MNNNLAAPPFVHRPGERWEHPIFRWCSSFLFFREITMKNNTAVRIVKGQDAVDYVRAILQPVSYAIGEARCATDGIVFVIHKPLALARKALKKTGMPFDRKGTTVLGATCSQAARVWGNDPVTKLWCEQPPVDGQIKVFLIVDNGSLLVTLNFVDDQVRVSVVPEVYGMN